MDAQHRGVTAKRIGVGALASVKQARNGSDILQNRMSELFRQFVRQDDDQVDGPWEHRGLYETTQGKTTEIASMVFLALLNEGHTFLITEAEGLGVAEHDANAGTDISWRRIEYDDAYFNVEAEEAAPRLTSFRESKGSAGFVYRMRGCSIADNVLRLDDGASHLLAMKVSLRNGFLSSLVQQNMLALLEADSRTYSELGVPLEDYYDALDKSMERFMIVQKDEKGLARLLMGAIDDMRTRRAVTGSVRPTQAIVSQGVLAYAVNADRSLTEYYRSGYVGQFGEPNEARIANAAPVVGMTLHELDAQIRDRREDYLIRSERVIGMYNLAAIDMDMYSSIPPKEYSSELRTIGIYDADRRDYVKVTLVDMLKNCIGFLPADDAPKNFGGHHDGHLTGGRPDPDFWLHPGVHTNDNPAFFVGDNPHDSGKIVYDYFYEVPKENFSHGYIEYAIKVLESKGYSADGSSGNGDNGDRSTTPPPTSLNPSGQKPRFQAKHTQVEVLEQDAGQSDSRPQQDYAEEVRRAVSLATIHKDNNAFAKTIQKALKTRAADLSDVTQTDAWTKGKATGLQAAGKWIQGQITDGLDLADDDASQLYAYAFSSPIAELAERTPGALASNSGEPSEEFGAEIANKARQVAMIMTESRASGDKGAILEGINRLRRDVFGIAGGEFRVEAPAPASMQAAFSGQDSHLQADDGTVYKRTGRFVPISYAASCPPSSNMAFDTPWDPKVAIKAGSNQLAEFGARDVVRDRDLEQDKATSRDRDRDSVPRRGRDERPSFLESFSARNQADEQVDIAEENVDPEVKRFAVLLGKALGMSTVPITRDILKKMAEKNIPVDMSFFLNKDNIRHEMSPLVAYVPGSATGNTYIKDINVAVQSDGIKRTHTISIAGSTGTGIPSPENVLVVPDVFSHQYLGGRGSRFYSSINAWKADRSENGMSADILCIPLPGRIRRDQFPLHVDLCGIEDPHPSDVDAVDYRDCFGGVGRLLKEALDLRVMVLNVSDRYYDREPLVRNTRLSEDHTCVRHWENGRFMWHNRVCKGELGPKTPPNAVDVYNGKLAILGDMKYDSTGWPIL